ncbi:hypothetical protein ITJ57_02310 [Plantibacter sp. VKM Ac-2880]|uniref:hypothetical protein n=1 Tax=Plantibacter sp. VKM Ac-2880 TaxID=2783827 RepID=UPI00188FCBDC|nr:hypothetical protein [Plantibacter sp. VKM Ac-2880]MBF4567587.1 hypothetical protein [Plantibacter sp. VKM Ac-2880]
MDSSTVLLVIGIVFVVRLVPLFILVLVWNRIRGQHDARRRQERYGDPAARHAGGYQSQRGRVYKDGLTNRQRTPNT